MFRNETCPSPSAYSRCDFPSVVPRIIMVAHAVMIGASRSVRKSGAGLGERLPSTSGRSESRAVVSLGLDDSSIRTRRTVCARRSRSRQCSCEGVHFHQRTRTLWSITCRSGWLLHLFAISCAELLRALGPLRRRDQLAAAGDGATGLHFLAPHRCQQNPHANHGWRSAWEWPSARYVEHLTITSESPSLPSAIST